MIARGERPGYRLLLGGDGRWRVDGLPGITVAAIDRHAASMSIRSTIAAALDVDPMAFDVDREKPCGRVRPPRPGHAPRSGHNGPANWGERAGPK